MARAFVSANTEYLEVNTAPATAAPFTMACWFRLNDVATSGQTMLSLVQSASSSHWFIMNTRGSESTLNAEARGTVQRRATSSSNMTNDTWHHGCAVFASSTDRTIYLDGGNSGNNTDSQTPASIDQFTIGRRGDSSSDQEVDGDIAEVVVYDIAFTAADAAALFAGSPLLVRPGHLVFYDRMIRGRTPTGGDSFDIVGGLTLTDFNTVTLAEHPRIIYPRPQMILSPSAVVSFMAGVNVGTDIIIGDH